MLKGILQSPRLKDHVKTIGIYQSLSNNDIFEHKCLQNISKLYTHAGKCDYQQTFKDILEAAMFSTPEVFTNNSPRSPMTPTPFKKPSAVKSLCLFTNILYVKEKTDIPQFQYAKFNRKAIKAGTTPWSLKPNREVNSKINEQIKKYLYNWIMHHPQVVISLIFNDCLKVNIGVHTRPQIVPKL